MTRKPSSLLSEIEAGALDASSDLPSVLRKCMTLGGVTRSDRLRNWAALELKGYGSEDELPSYREITAALLLDGATGRGIITGQVVPLTLIPEFARDMMSNDVPFPQPIAQLVDLVSSARDRGETSVRLAPPGSRELIALMNAEFRKQDREMFPGVRDLPVTQWIERIYWSVSVSAIAGILDVVRTTLVELVAEMRAGTLSNDGLPSREITEQAVDVAIYGKRHRIVINQLGSHSPGAVLAGGAVSAGSDQRESTQRRLMWWLVSAAGIIGAIAAVWALFR